MVSPRKFRFLCNAIVVALCVVHAGLLLVGIRRNFVVVDEIGHVAAGVADWQVGDFSVYRVNPPLSRMLAALPVLAARPRTTYAHVDHRPGGRPEGVIGRDLAELNAPRYFELVCLARLPGVLWSLLGALVICRWCRELYGDPAGCLGVALWCSDPTVLAFAQVVTPDIPAAVAGLAATYVFWHYLNRRSWPLAVGSGILLGVAQLTKFTMLILYGVWPMIAFAHWLGRRRRGDCLQADAAQPCRNACQSIAVVMMSIYVINFGYFFEDTCWPLRDYRFVSQVLAGPGPHWPPGEGGNRFRGGWLGAVRVPLPVEFLQGIDVQRRDFESELPSYLRGEWRNRGWWYYYLYALCIKEPLGSWGLVFWGLALTLARRPRSVRWDKEAALWLPVVVVVVLVSSQTGFNHHMRYVLPAFPFVAVATGKVGRFVLSHRPWARAAALAFLGWSVMSVLLVYPHVMSYFNEAVGGPEHGHEHLVDSNIDWGQDLLHLRDWLKEHPEARPLGLAFFHYLDPRLFGIDYHLPPLGPPSEQCSEQDVPAAELGPKPGYYAVSVNYLRGIKFSAPDGEGGWRGIDRHDAFTYFQHFRPIARAGYSIYIYHITAEQADAVRRKMGLPPLGP